MAIHNLPFFLEKKKKEKKTMLYEQFILIIVIKCEPSHIDQSYYSHLNILARLIKRM